jgi:Tryptophan synthase alpha chain
VLPLQRGERIERILDKIRAPLPRRTVAANGRPELRSPVDEEKFRSRVAAIKEYIRAGDVIQTVFSQPFTSDQAPNPWRLYRASAFHRDALKAGADGVLVVDLPPEEAGELLDRWLDNGLCLIRLTTPTTPVERMRRIASSASGFIYHVSKLGVTGSGGLSLPDIADKVRELRAVTQLPICVGFGISTPAQVSAICDVCDGVVIGSALERLIEDNVGKPDLSEILAERVAVLKQATRRNLS